MKKSKLDTTQCISQGDCVVCGVKDVKGRLDKFPICYDCYASGKGTDWIIKTSLEFLKTKKEKVDKKHLKTLNKAQQGKLLMELCQKYIQVKEK